MFALRATVNTTTQYTPAQSFFRRDSTINRRCDVDKEKITKENKTLSIKAMNVKIVVE